VHTLLGNLNRSTVDFKIYFKGIRKQNDSKLITLKEPEGQIKLRVAFL
jgi:hypothetical protein